MLEPDYKIRARAKPAQFDDVRHAPEPSEAPQ